MPTYIFGEGPTATVSGTHKDTYLVSGAAARSFATQGNFILGNSTGNDYVYLARFDISSIPAGEPVVSATLTLTLMSDGLTGDRTVNIHRVLTAWGVNDTDEGANENPATGGQATYDNAKDCNGVGDVGWAAGVGAGWGAGDYDAVADASFVIGAADVAGTQYNAILTALVNEWHTGSAQNHGLVLLLSGPAGDWANLDSQDSGSAAERPLLTVVTAGGPTPPTPTRRKDYPWRWPHATGSTGV